MTLLAALRRHPRPAPPPPPSCLAVASGVLTEDQAAELRARIDEAAGLREPAAPAGCPPQDESTMPACCHDVTVFGHRCWQPPAP